MSPKTIIKLFFLIVMSLHIPAWSNEDIPLLKNLDLKSPELKALRNDVKETISVVKGQRQLAELPDIKFYEYKVKKGDNLWNIISKTSLDLDTILTINSLSSPDEIKPGKTIYIPNMRGIISVISTPTDIETLADKYNISARYIYAVNKIDANLKKKIIFIPCGTLSDSEKSLFMGTGFLYPVKSAKMTSMYGQRIDPINFRPKFHTGIDLACPIGSQISASREGKVVFTGYKGGYGKLIIIEHSNGFSTYYGHLSKINVVPGQYVKNGQFIGLSGNTGRTTGPHLHFEIRKKSSPVNPRYLMKRI